jgi:hypothetical protein
MDDQLFPLSGGQDHEFEEVPGPAWSDHEPALRLIAEEVCNHPISECMGNVLVWHSVAPTDEVPLT